MAKRSCCAWTWASYRSNCKLYSQEAWTRSSQDQRAVRWPLLPSLRLFFHRSPCSHALVSISAAAAILKWFWSLIRLRAASWQQTATLHVMILYCTSEKHRGNKRVGEEAWDSRRRSFTSWPFYCLEPDQARLITASFEFSETWHVNCPERLTLLYYDILQHAKAVAVLNWFVDKC